MQNCPYLDPNVIGALAAAVVAVIGALGAFALNLRGQVKEQQQVNHRLVEQLIAATNASREMGSK